MSVDQSKLFVKRQNTGADAFLGGRLMLLQPRHGFRAGSDSVLLGASVPPATRRLLDLGAGAGAAGLVAALWAETAEVLLAERDEEALALAHQNIERNGLAARVRAVRADIAAAGVEREAAGLVPDSFDSVIANPPFFASERGTLSPEANRASARHAGPDAIEAWSRAAAAATAPRGEAIFILPARRLGEALAAFGRRFGNIRILPVASRPGGAAGRVLVRGTKGSRAGLTLLSPLVMHGLSGNAYAPQAADILMGRTNHDW
ncbi:MAG: methyltransferase [Alphaproteobacteria bacterium]|nr:methyltransferase [Alphaproteobacteria bacterium]